jgi:hypothetical protein
MDDVTNRSKRLFDADDAPSSVEALLRAAAHFTPDTAPPVPDTLAFRALERAGLLLGVPRGRRAGRFRPFVLSGGALTGALAAATFVFLRPPVATRTVLPAEQHTLSSEPARASAARVVEKDVPAFVPVNAASLTAFAAEDASAAARTPRPVSHSRGGRAGTPSARRRGGSNGSGVPRSRREAAPRTHPLVRQRALWALHPPKAHWQTRTVERKNYGVLAPAWVTFHAQPDTATVNAGGAASENEDEIVGAVPVVVDLPLNGDGDARVIAAADIVPVYYDPHP